MIRISVLVKVNGIRHYSFIDLIVPCISEISCPTFYVVYGVKPEVYKDQQAMHIIFWHGYIR